MKKLKVFAASLAIISTVTTAAFANTNKKVNDSSSTGTGYDKVNKSDSKLDGAIDNSATRSNNAGTATGTGNNGTDNTGTSASGTGRR